MKNIIATIIFLTLIGLCSGQAFDRTQALKVATAAKMMVPNSQVISVAATGSMKPMLDENCLLVITKEPFETVSVRDVVVYTSEKGNLVVHRVMEKRRDGSLWTKGDNNGRPDREYVTSEKYVGKVFSVTYYRGQALPTGVVAAASN